MSPRYGRDDPEQQVLEYSIHEYSSTQFAAGRALRERQGPTCEPPNRSPRAGIWFRSVRVRRCLSIVNHPPPPPVINGSAWRPQQNIPEQARTGTALV